jgi:hypothetical protein
MHAPIILECSFSIYNVADRLDNKESAPFYTLYKIMYTAYLLHTHALCKYDVDFLLQETKSFLRN